MASFDMSARTFDVAASRMACFGVPAQTFDGAVARFACFELSARSLDVVAIAVTCAISPLVGLPWPVREGHGQRSSFSVISKYTRQKQTQLQAVHVEHHSNSSITFSVAFLSFLDHS